MRIRFNTVDRFLLLLTSVFTLLVGQVAIAAPVIPSPSKEVETVTKQLLSTFEGNKERYRKEPAFFFEEVDRLLSPVVAFDAISRSVMGKFAHSAENKHIAEFEKVLKNSLINYYGKTLLKLDDTSVSIEKVSSVPEKEIKELINRSRTVPVNMTIKSKSQVYEIMYSMMFRDNRWQLKNITVEGINIGKQFRSQFEQAMQEARQKTKESSEALNYVITRWPDIMAGNEKEEDDKQKRTGG